MSDNTLHTVVGLERFYSSFFAVSIWLSKEVYQANDDNSNIPVVNAVILFSLLNTLFEELSRFYLFLILLILL